MAPSVARICFHPSHLSVSHQSQGPAVLLAVAELCSLLLSSTSAAGPEPSALGHPRSTSTGAGEQLPLCIHAGPRIWESTAQPGNIRTTEPLRLEKTPKNVDSSHYLSLLCPESLQEQFSHTWFIILSTAPAEQLSLPVLTLSSRDPWSRSETRLSGRLFPHPTFHARVTYHKCH